MADNSPLSLLSGATDIVNMLIFSNSEITDCPVNISHCHSLKKEHPKGEGGEKKSQKTG